jgi:[ribosomal protein S18]-alanine N-acetyltransferase
MSQTDYSVIVRAASAQDIDEVTAIESGSVSMWKRDFFVQELHTPNSVFLVAEIEGAVVGYIVARKIFDEAEILSIAVSPARMRSGIGTLLFRALDELLAPSPGVSVYLEVRELNTAAREFYKSRRFREIGRRTLYYNNEDAILMVRDEG